jgi:hypothetical protein
MLPGDRLALDAPVTDGDPLPKRAELADIRLHECGSATMVFATTAHSIHALRRLALGAEQDTA